jgi:succinyl-CoA synthetase beta subunit
MRATERMAKQKEIKYVHLGNHPIGIVSNSAGMALATADLIE